MAAESSHDGTVPQSEETKNRPDWLIDIMMKEQQKEPLIEAKEGQEQQTRAETLIEKADISLRYYFPDQFYPSKVSFGPYHHKGNTESMETYKEVAAHWFISLAADKRGERITEDDVFKVYQKFSNNVASLSPKYKYWYTRPKYPEEKEFGLYMKLLREYDEYDEHLMRMMFLDGCFVLNFIHLVADKSDASSG